MQDMLVAVNDVDEAGRIMPKVNKLMEGMSDAASLTAVRVVYEGLADLNSRQVEGAGELKRFVLEAEASVLKDALESSTDLDVECLTLWNKNRWQGILDAAESVGASVIAKQVTEPETSVYVRTPDDWNLIRHSSVPVLLSHSAWLGKPTVFAALDVHDENHADLNRRVLRNAQHLCDRLQAELHIVCVYPQVSRWLEQVAGARDHQLLRTELDQEVSGLVSNVCKDAGIEHYQLHVREGTVDIEIESVAASAAVIVIGTKARSGVSAALIGNTAEKILHNVRTDVLTVP